MKRSLPSIAGALAISLPAAPLQAQGFDILGKGIELSGGSERTVSVQSNGTSEVKTKVQSRPYQFKPVGDFIVAGWTDGRCNVNGVPTPTGIVYSKRRAHAAHIVCDPIRKGTRSKYEETKTTVEFQSKASVAGGVVTFEVHYNAKSDYVTVEGEHSSGFTQATTGRSLIRVRIRGGTCEVVEHLTLYRARSDVHLTSGATSWTDITETFVNDPPETCRFVE